MKNALSIGVALLTALLCVSPAMSYEKNPYGLRFPHQGGYMHFPEDEGSHPGLSDEGGVEWWAFYGMVGTADGRRFTLSTKFWDLQFPWLDLVGEWAFDMPEMAVTSLGDLQTGKQYNNHSGVAIDGETIDLSKLDLQWQTNSIRQLGPFVYELILEDPDNEVLVELRLAAQRYPLPIGWDGVVQFTEGFEQNIYAITRLVATGTITIGGEGTFEVQGMFGMDHGWYPSSILEHVDFLGTRDNYEFVSIQLHDSTDVVMWKIQFDGSQSAYIPAVNILYPDGSFEFFHEEDIQSRLRKPSMEALGGYANEDSGNNYSLGWEVTIPSAGLELSLYPFFNDQEKVSQDATFMDNSIYSTMCWVVGTNNKEPVTGQAYFESTTRYPEPEFPNPPTDLSVVEGTGSVVLSWSPVDTANIDEYRVYLGTKTRQYNLDISAGSSTQYVLQGLENLEKYYFAVTAIDDQGRESFFSEEVMALPNDGFTPYVDARVDLPCFTGGQEINVSFETINPGNPAIPVDLYVLLQLDDGTFIQMVGDGPNPQLQIGVGGPSMTWNIPGRFAGTKQLYTLPLEEQIFGAYVPLQLLVGAVYNPPADFPTDTPITPVVVDIDTLEICLQ